MNVLPVIVRELRQQARRPLTRWARMGVAAFSTLLVLSNVLSWSATRGAPRSTGDWAFHALAWFGLFFTWGAAFLTSDAISRERREGTLGLLFLTDLSGFDVVLAKFASMAFGGILALIGITPILMVALLPGGVTGGEVIRVTLVLVESLLLALALGVFISTLTGAAMHAARSTAIWLLALVVSPWLIARLPTLASLSSGIELLSPLATFQLVGDIAFRAAPNRFWLSVCILMLETVIFLLAAGQNLASNWRQEIAETPVEHASRDSNVRRGVNPLGDAEPVAWLIGRRHRQTALLWTAAVMFVSSQSGLLFTLIYRLAGPLGITPAFYRVFSAVATGVPLALFALAAGRFSLNLHRTGVFELLSVTPVGAQDLIRGQLGYLRRALLGPTILAMAQSPLMALIILASPSMNKNYLSLWHALLLMPAQDLLTIVAAVLLGLVFGSRCRSAAALMAWTVGLIVGTQWLWGFAYSFLITIIPSATRTLARTMPITLPLYYEMYALVKLAIIVALIVWAKRQLGQRWTFTIPPRITWSELLRRVRHWTPSGLN